MKKISMPVLFVILLISGNIYSQNLSVGARAGLNVIPLEKNDFKGNLYSLGYHVGGVVDYRINKWFSVSAEVTYTTRKKSYKIYDTTSFIETITNNPIIDMLGVDIIAILDTLGGGIDNYINDNVYNTTHRVVNLSYIKIPVLAKFNYKSLYLSVGPYVSFLVSDKTTEEFSQHVPIIETLTILDTIPFYSSIVGIFFPGYSNPVTATTRDDKNIKKIDFGFIADISYHLDNHFTVGVRYTQGILNYLSPEIYKNDFLSSLNFSVGYLFNFKNNSKSMLK